MDENTKKELQSKAFERLITHLRERKDVQNIDLMNLAGFVETVFPSGTEKKQKKKVLKFLILMQENMFMECHTLIGKTNIKNNHFSLSLGNNSTKLQGL